MANTRTRKINQNVELNTTYDFVANDGTFSGVVTGNSFVGPLTGDVTGTVSSLSNHDTADLAEGTNLYFTIARARASFSAGTGVNITSGVISIGQSVSTASDVTFGSVTATTFSGALTGDVTGNADTASALEAAVNIALTGSVTGNVDFDGSGNVSITTTTNHNHDDRYYTETESDGKYLLNTTDTLDGDLTITGDLNVTGTIDLSNADLNIGAADIIFDTASAGATRGLMWNVSGSGILSKIIGGGTDGGKVTLFANINDAITTGNIFEIKDGSLGSLFLGLSHAGILTAGGGTSTLWNTAYDYSTIGHLPLAGGTLSGNLWINGSILSGSSAGLQVQGFMRTGPIMIANGTTANTTFDDVEEKWITNNAGTLTIGPGNAHGDAILHAGNYSSYALPLSGGTVTGNVTIQNGDLLISRTAVNGTATRKIRFAEGITTSSGFQGGYIYYNADSNVFQIGVHDAADTNTANDIPAISINRATANITTTNITATNITATSFVKSGGTSSQFLKADGSVDSNTYLTTIPTPINGDWWNLGFVRVGTDGVMEMGKYMDFHTSDSEGNADFDLRVTVTPGVFSVGGQINATGGNSLNWNTAYDYSVIGHLPLSGGTLTGALNLASNLYYEGNGNYALDLNNSDIIGLNSLYFNDNAENAGEGINFTNDATGNWSTLRASNGVLYFAPNRASTVGVDGSIVLHSTNFTNYTDSKYLRSDVDDRGTGLTIAPTTTNGNGKIRTLFNGGSPALEFSDNAGTIGADQFFAIGANDVNTGKFDIRFKATEFGSAWDTEGTLLAEFKADNGSVGFPQGRVGIGTDNYGTTAAKLLVGPYIDSSSSAIAQFDGFLRIKDQIIIHDPSYTTAQGILAYTSAYGMYYSGSGGGNNFGIGTTTPGYKLHVVGEALIDGGVGVASSGTLHVRQKGDTSADGIALTSSNGTSHRIWKDASGKLNFGPPSFPSAFVQDLNGNIGIGTTSPEGLLHISSSTSGDAIVIIEADTDNDTEGDIPQLWFRADGGINESAIINNDNRLEFVNNVASGGGIAFLTGATNNYGLTAPATGASVKMLIKTNGNVGIGTTDPGTKLHVAGGDIYTDSQFRLDQGQGITWNNGDNYIRGISGYHLQFTTYDGASAQQEVLRLTGGSAASGGGRVGIGTTSPAEKLEVNGSIRIDNYISTNSNYISYNQKAYYTDTWRKTTSGRARQLQMGEDNSGTLEYRISNVSGGSANDAITWTSIFVANDAGNIGIGTTSPGAKLEVFGTGNTLRLDSAANGAKELLFRNVGTQTATIKTDGHLKLYTEDAGRNIYFDTSGGTKAIILDNGNVGVGTTSPQQKLTIDGTSSGAYIRISNAASGDISSGFMIYNGNNLDTQIYTNPTFGNTTLLSRESWAIRAGGSQRMAILSNGNVGIGTTSPQKPIDVVSNVNDFVTVGARGLAIGQWTGIHFGYREDNTSYRKSAIVFERTDLTAGDGQGKIHILNGPQNSGGSASLSDSKLTIAENGFVGIGTTGPSGKLQINGPHPGGYGLLRLAGTTATIIDMDGQDTWDVRVRYKRNGTDYWFLGMVDSSVFKLTDASNVTKLSVNQSGDTYVSNRLSVATTNFGTTEAKFLVGDYLSNGSSAIAQFNGFLRIKDQIIIHKSSNTSQEAYLQCTDSGVMTTGGTFRALGDVIAYASSDRELKDNITPIPNALDKVKAIGGYEFDWNDKQDIHEGHDIGVIAQEVEAVLPEIVTTRENGYKAVKYEKLVAVLIEAVKELSAEVEQLKKQK